MHEELLVIPESMQFIKDGKVPCFVGIERSGKHNAVRNAAAQNFAGDRVALDATGSEGGRNVKEEKEERGE